MTEQKEQDRSIQIKATDDALKGLYSNMAQVSHSAEEVVLDFMSVFPPAGNLVSRIILSPAHAKRLAGALSENIKRYESQHGEIKAGTDSEHKFGFRTE